MSDERQNEKWTCVVGEANWTIMRDLQNLFVMKGRWPKKMWLQIQASKMRFLHKFEVVTLFEKVSSSEIRKFLIIEPLPLLLCIERSQLRWLVHVKAECFKKDFLNKLDLRRKKRLGLRDDREHIGMTTLKILNEIVWTSHKRINGDGSRPWYVALNLKLLSASLANTHEY